MTPNHYFIKGFEFSLLPARSQYSILLNAFDQLLTRPNISWEIVNLDSNFVDEIHSDCFLSGVHAADCRACTT
jgi:hypothetical protein